MASRLIPPRDSVGALTTREVNSNASVVTIEMPARHVEQR
jgi:hypothetical protein